MSRSTQSEVLTVRLPAVEARAFRAIARADGRTVAGLLRRLALQHMAAVLEEGAEGAGGAPGPERPPEDAHAPAS